MLKQTVIDVIFAWAVTMSPYSTDVQPEVAFVPTWYLESVACGGEPCGVVGLYTDDDVVYVANDLPKYLMEEVLFHEIIHYLQDKSGSFTSGECDDNYAREVEAYSLSQRWVVDVMGRLPMPHSLMVFCDGEAHVGDPNGNGS